MRKNKDVLNMSKPRKFTREPLWKNDLTTYSTETTNQIKCALKEEDMECISSGY